MNYDFGGYATKNDIVCTDGRVIRANAFKHNDGQKVPIVWQHDYSSPENVLGYGILENRSDGVYIYGSFNDNPLAQIAKRNVEHGDITSMSIKAIQCTQKGNDVLHGNIKEVSLVVGGANSGAKIDTVIKHDDSDEMELLITLGDEGLDVFEHDFDDSIYDEPEDDLEELKDEPEDESKDNSDDKEGQDDKEKQIEHADDSNNDEKSVEEIVNSLTEDEKNVMYYIVGEVLKQNGITVDAEEDKDDDDDKKDINMEHESNEKTVKDVLDGMSQEKLDVMYYMIGQALSEAGIDENKIKEKEEVEHSMAKFRVFENKNGVVQHDDENSVLHTNGNVVLTHDDEVAIMERAKKNKASSFKEVMKEYMSEKYGIGEESFAHGVFSEGDLEYLHPDYKLVKEGEPDTITFRQDWVEAVINKVGKSPKSRLRVRIIDAKTKELKAKGYIKGMAKTKIGNVKLINRTVDPQTVYVRDDIHRDDVVDITDFDIAVYENKILQMILKQELALAMLIGDGRDDGDPDKIYENHIQPIWTDDEIFTIHADVDLEAMKTKLQGTDTGKYFGDDFVLVEAFIETLRMSRINYYGSGNLDMFCTPTTVNRMLLARDRDGHRIYKTLEELRSALNVRNIYEVELLEGLVRTDDSMQKHKLHAIFVNFADYETGSNKGGEITSFEDFDIDFNQLKYLKETRLSGMLTRIKSAIVIEERTV